MDSLRAAVKDAIQMTATLRNATKTGSSNVVNPDLRELHQSNTDRSDSLGFQRNAQTQKVSFWVNFWENIQLLPMFSDNQYGSPVAEINLTSFEALNKIKTSFSARFTKASESEFAESNSIKQSFARSESILDHRKAQKDRDQSAICSTNLSLGDSCISEWLIPCNCKVETIQTTLDSSNNCNINSHCERFCEELIPIALYSHGSNAIEETQFLFQEIFSEKVYLQHGITVALDDLVVDIGWQQLECT